MSMPRNVPVVNPQAKAKEQRKSVRFFITSPMANSQVSTSKNPSIGARYFIPRVMKMVRRVHRVTTHISAKKMNPRR